MSQIITEEKLKRLCIVYIGSNELKEVSYTELFNFLTKKNVDLPLATPDPHNNDLLKIMGELTFFDFTTYQNPPNNYISSGMTVKEVRLGLLIHRIPVKDSVHDQYVNEQRISKSERISNISLGIAVAAFIITGVQLWVDYYDIHYGKDYKFEKTTMHADSIQVFQNQKIIELIEKQNTTIESTRKQDSIYYQKEIFKLHKGK